MKDETKDPDRPTDQVVMMIREIFGADSEAIGCEECFGLFEQCAELIEAGGDLAGIYPEVKKHFNGCEGCKEEFEALLSALKAAQHPAAEAD